MKQGWCRLDRFWNGVTTEGDGFLGRSLRKHKLQEWIMPEMTVDVPIRQLASMINRLNRKELETLSLFLTKKGSELLERNRDLDSKSVEYLTEDEAFDV
jgi:hypothetical protein